MVTISKTLKEVVSFIDPDYGIEYDVQIQNVSLFAGAFSRNLGLIYTKNLKEMEAFMAVMRKTWYTSRSFKEMLSLTDTPMRAGIFTKRTMELLALQELPRYGAFVLYEYELPILTDASSFSSGGKEYTEMHKEMVALAEALSRTTFFARTFAEAPALFDAQTRIWYTTRAFKETMALYDKIAKTWFISRTLKDPFALTEATQKTWYMARTFKEQMELADAFSSSRTLPRTFTEQASLIDTFAYVVGKAYSEQLTDFMVFLEPPRYGAYVFNLYELPIFVDSFSGEIEHIYAESFNEMAILVDTYAQMLTMPRQFAEHMSLVDSTSKTWFTGRTLTERLSLVEELQKKWILSRGLIESFSIVDSLSKTWFMLRQLREFAILVDSASVSFNITIYLETHEELASLIDSLTPNTIAHFLRVFDEMTLFYEHCTPTYFEGCLDYDYMVSVFNELAKLAGGKSIAREMELFTDP